MDPVEIHFIIKSWYFLKTMWLIRRGKMIRDKFLLVGILLYIMFAVESRVQPLWFYRQLSLRHLLVPPANFYSHW